ncbi:MAG TPA: response regulator, partial [Candidatus Cloacimonadota bacterium]|nr:response regulator [Candidatus Cloacimonadota bacterium]
YACSDQKHFTQGKGTGLGLSITKRIIDEYNGKIIVESELNKGTTFQILLPAAKSEPAIEDKTIIINETQITNVEPLHIVIVDDEEFVLEIAKELLQELGNTVYTAQSGAEALEIVKSHADIKLALIDRMMPKMDGVELFYKLKELKPDIKVVIASGFKNEEETKLLKNDGLSDYITKPYRIDEISRIISEV